MKRLVQAQLKTLAMILTVVIPFSAQAEGPSGSGGGNTINGRLIEDFAVKKVDQDSRFVGARTVLENLKSKAPFLAGTLTEAMYGLTFYIVPSELPKLPWYVNGLSFNSDQTAFQSRGEVWINETLFNEMLGKGTHTDLIIHELVMSEAIRTSQYVKVGPTDHTRTRMLTNAILQGLSGESLNAAIKDNGFESSAVADVWSYGLLIAPPGVPTDGRGMVIAKKGTRILLYQCSSEALQPIRERQVDTDQVVFKGIRRMLSQTVQSNGCALAAPVMYTITADFASRARNLIEERRGRGQLVGGLLGAPVGLAAGAALAMLGAAQQWPHYTRGGILLLAGGAVGFFDTGLMANIGANIGANIQDRRYTLREMEIALANYGDIKSVQQTTAEMNELRDNLIKGFEELTRLGYALKTPVSQAK